MSYNPIGDGQEKTQEGDSEESANDDIIKVIIIDNGWTWKESVELFSISLTLAAVLVAIWSTSTANRSVRIADSTLNVMKRQFEIQNLPILSIDAPYFGVHDESDEIARMIDVKVNNLGNYPIQLLRSKFGYVEYKGLPDTFYINKLNSVELEKDLTYVSREIPIHRLLKIEGLTEMAVKSSGTPYIVLGKDGIFESNNARIALFRICFENSIRRI